MKGVQKKEPEQARWCEYCQEIHVAEELVPVVGGSIIGSWTDPEAYIGVAGLTDGFPDTKFYCPVRYEYDFDTEPPKYVRKNLDSTTHNISASEVVAFSLGCVLTAILLLLFVT